MSAATALAWRDDSWQFGNGAARFSNARSAAFRVAIPEVSAPTTSSRPGWFDQTLDQFLELAELEDDWDGRGSAQVRRDVLSFALRSVLPEIMPPTAPAPSAIPLGNGGIQLVWNSKDAEVEIEVAAPNDVVASYFDKVTGKQHDERLTNDFSTLADVMWSIYKG